MKKIVSNLTKDTSYKRTALPWERKWRFAFSVIFMADLENRLLMASCLFKPALSPIKSPKRSCDTESPEKIPEPAPKQQRTEENEGSCGLVAFI